MTATIEKLELRREMIGNELKEYEERIEELCLKPLTLPRPHRTPRKISGAASDFNALSVHQHYRLKYYEAFDTAMQQLRKRFDEGSPGLSSFFRLLCWQNDDLFDEDSEVTREIMRIPGINIFELRSEMKVLSKTINKNFDLESVTSKFQEMHTTTRQLFPNFETLLRNLLVRPASSVECERSFSALRRLKTWLRSTMTQKRLNSVVLLHVQRDTLEKIDMEKLIHNFVSRNPWRLSQFGN